MAELSTRQHGGSQPMSISPAGPTARRADNQNVSAFERMLSLAGGSGLLAYGLSRRNLPGLALAAVGGGLVYRGLSGFCSLYHALGINTADRPEGPMASVRAGHGFRIDETITVGCPPEHLYAFWRDFQNLPRIMRHLERVDVINARRSHWVAKGPLGLRVEWDAVIHTERENELISWRSLPGSDIDTAGSVHFRRIPGGEGTLVRVELKYNPLGGQLGAAVARLLGEAPEVQIREDLEHFKQEMEGRDGACATIGSTRGGSLEHRHKHSDDVHNASDDSFPASDPPGHW